MIVGAGGFIGSALRFALAGWVQRLPLAAGFPLGTFAVNMLGCLLIGLVGGVAENRHWFEPGHRLFLMVGVLGGFTTFSAVAYESMFLLQDSAWLRALTNTALQIALGCAAAFVGYSGARLI